MGIRLYALVSLLVLFALTRVVNLMVQFSTFWLGWTLWLFKLGLDGSGFMLQIGLLLSLFHFTLFSFVLIRNVLGFILKFKRDWLTKQ